jgi:hypothetical protein
VPDEAEDAELESMLREAAAWLDPVPAELIQAATAAFGWRNVDAELAELVLDSLLDRPGAALVRGSGGPRLLHFRADLLTIEVEVTGTGSACELIGQVFPAQRAGLEIRHGAQVDHAAIDDLGRFRVEFVPAGPVSLYCRPASGGTGTAVVTDWIPL